MKSAIDGLGCLGALSSPLNAPADVAERAKRSAKPHHHAAQPQYSREEVECERAHAADPTGHYARYPYWARSAQPRQSQGTLRRPKPEAEAIGDVPHELPGTIEPGERA
jgi:hypothetical protein